MLALGLKFTYSKGMKDFVFRFAGNDAPEKRVSTNHDKPRMDVFYKDALGHVRKFEMNFLLDKDNSARLRILVGDRVINILGEHAEKLNTLSR